MCSQRVCPQQMRLSFSARILSGFSMKQFLLIALLVMLQVPKTANAEGGCPAGQYPQQGQGWQTCVPIPESGQTRRAPQAPAAVWRSNWQAIATDSSKGILGTSIDRSTMQEAEMLALNDCKSKGGTHCTIAISNGNGCIAMVTGNALLTTGAGRTKAEAESSAINNCTSDDTGCHVYYSACSLPVRIQ